MIFKSQNELSPKVEIELNNVSVNYFSIHSVSINLEENKHDVATITINGIPPKAITDYIDAAVKIKASIGAGREVEFCGYVLYVEPQSTSSAALINESVFQRAKIVCFGTSVSMKSTTTRVWETASVFAIAKELSSRYSLSADIIKDSFVIPKIIQTKKSDWEFLTDFCKKYGYSVTVHGTHMRVWDSNKALGRIQSFEVLTTPSRLTTLQPGSIIRFSGTFGYLTPEGKSYNYSVESIDDVGRILKTTGNHKDASLMWSGVGNATRYNSSLMESSNSAHESEKIIEANFKSKLPFNAVVDVSTALGTIPGGVVVLDGYGSNFEGYWYVRAVDHEIVGSTCTSRLRISKDFNTTNTAVIPPVELGVIPPRPKLINNIWKSSVERVITYV